MANRIFDVKITAGTDLGPYDIYYNSGSGNVLAIYQSTSGTTTNVSYSDLTTGTGVRVLIPDTSITITLLNTKTDFLLIYFALSLLKSNTVITNNEHQKTIIRYNHDAICVHVLI